jgi:hypothetical protein
LVHSPEHAIGTRNDTLDTINTIAIQGNATIGTIQAPTDDDEGWMPVVKGKRKPKGNNTLIVCNGNNNKEDKPFPKATFVEYRPIGRITGEDPPDESEDELSVPDSLPPLIARDEDDDNSSIDSCASLFCRKGTRYCYSSSDSDDDSYSDDSVPPLMKGTYDSSSDDDSSTDGDLESLNGVDIAFDDIDDYQSTLLEHKAGREFATPTVDLATLHVNSKGAKIGPNTYLADTGASSHMGPGDEGMFDFEDKSTTIKVGNGKHLSTGKIGKRKGTVIQQDGTEVQLTLKQYKQVPDLWVNLFSVTAALSDGWKLGNEGKAITISKVKVTLKFDKIFESGDGYVCGVEIVPTTEAASMSLAAGTSMDINEFHHIFNHVADETLTLTAAAHDIKLTGTL